MLRKLYWSSMCRNDGGQQNEYSQGTDLEGGIKIGKKVFKIKMPLTSKYLPIFKSETTITTHKSLIHFTF